MSILIGITLNMYVIARREVVGLGKNWEFGISRCKR